MCLNGKFFGNAVDAKCIAGSSPPPPPTPTPVACAQLTLPKMQGGSWTPAQASYTSNQPVTLSCVSGLQSTVQGATITCGNGQWFGNGLKAECKAAAKPVPPGNCGVAALPQVGSSATWNPQPSQQHSWYYESNQVIALACPFGQTATVNRQPTKVTLVCAGGTWAGATSGVACGTSGG